MIKNYVFYSEKGITMVTFKVIFSTDNKNGIVCTYVCNFGHLNNFHTNKPIIMIKGRTNQHYKVEIVFGVDQYLSYILRVPVSERVAW